eukprot:CAMPEP_0182436660 /NCGR_PEP_ID=MMETSP1167-20130531/82757_1 /TAXON_ID=2988 /ORGANISM="Mallomonas Sp, Strain CCMP3275" /LENGTH=156 /DNA_ID=CAMNT_0024629053 /DNA_START=291 /DNA_END=761 /DNA_ORIENTATION=+
MSADEAESLMENSSVNNVYKSLIQLQKACATANMNTSAQYYSCMVEGIPQLPEEYVISYLGDALRDQEPSHPVTDRQSAEKDESTSESESLTMGSANETSNKMTWQPIINVMLRQLITVVFVIFIMRYVYPEWASKTPRRRDIPSSDIPDPKNFEF